MKFEHWKAYTIDNPYSDDELLVYTCKDMYYFKLPKRDARTKVYRIILGRIGINTFDWYKDLELQLYSGRKHLFLQEEVPS